MGLKLIKPEKRKFNLHIDSKHGATMDDYDFFVVLATMNSRLVVKKEEMIRVDSDNYVLMLDTEKIGTGKVSAQLTAYIPDADYADGIGTEVVDLDLDMYVTNSI